MRPERERAIEAAIEAATEAIWEELRIQGISSVVLDDHDKRALGEAAVDALLALPDPVRDAAREVIATGDAPSPASESPLEAWRLLQQAIDRLRAALEESEG